MSDVETTGKRSRKQTERLGDAASASSEEVSPKKKSKAPKEKKEKAAPKEKKEKAPRAKKEKKERVGPKRPLSSFLLFSAEYRDQVREENPDFKMGDVSKELGVMWKEASASERKKFEDQAAELKEAYLEEKEKAEKAAGKASKK